MYRLNPLRVKTVWKSQGELEKAFTEEQSLQYSVCPFTIILGTINSTEAGYKPPNSIPNDYTSFSKIFTGREAIQAVWDHSYVPVQDDPVNNPNDAYKQIKAGDVFFGNVVSDQVGIAYSASAQNNAFIQEQAVKNVVINIPNQGKNFDFINNILANIYKLYVIPEINAIRNSDNTFQVDRQWYILETATKTYNNNTKELAYIQCTFVSLNDRLATSGLAINQYVQLGAPGDPVAFPTIDENKNVVLDHAYLTPLPVTHCQISFYGTVKDIAIALWGRPIDNSPTAISTLKFKQYPSQLLFPWQYQCSTYDPISFQALPETNYFLTVNDSSQATLYTDWRNSVLPAYDRNSNFHYEGENATNSVKTKATNTVDVSGRYVNYWDTNFLNGVTIEDTNYSTAGNPYFQYYNPNTKMFIGNTHYNMNNNQFKQLNTINAMHYFVYNPITEVPLSVKETIKININTIPVFGSFMNFFVGGLNINAKTVSNLLIPQFPYISGLISAELYNFYITVLYGTTTPSDPVSFPLDVFRNGTTDAVQGLLGTASHMTSFTFNLTDTMTLSQFNINTGALIGNGVNPTVNLGQISPNTDLVNLMQTDDNDSPLLVTPDFTDTNLAKWAIDMLDIKVMGKADFKITFYSHPDNREEAVNDDYAIWSGTYQTIAKASNNIRLIANTFVLANNNFNFDTPYNFPQAIIPPPLQPRAIPIMIDLSNQTQYGIVNDINGTIFSTTQNLYEMRNRINKDTDNTKFARHIKISIEDYGYDSFTNFMNDYESLTFNFSFKMSATWKVANTFPTYTNNKNYFTPVTINLTDINPQNPISPVNSQGSFFSDDTNYSNNSGDHEDSQGNWTFNINNGGTPTGQIATLLPTPRLSVSYVNNLSWTNNSPSSGNTIASSVWFKIIAYQSDAKTITLTYLFIASFDNLSVSSGIRNANWNLQSNSIVINPKSSVFTPIIEDVSRETLKGGD